jgi:hypothetical protein
MDSPVIGLMNRNRTSGGQIQAGRKDKIRPGDGLDTLTTDMGCVGLIA